MSELARKSCEPCRGGVAPLPRDQVDTLLEKLDDAWLVVDHHHLSRTYEFPDFAQALAFTNRVGGIAESEGHHPDIHLAWGRVRLDIWTHKIDGLTESDFILAAKADEVQRA